MPVQVYNNQRKVKFTRGQWDAAFAAALEASGHADGMVEVSLLSNSAIAVLNKEWRDKDGPTDCLSFPFAPDVPLPPDMTERPLGDIVISLERAAEQGPIHIETPLPGHDAFFSEVVFLFIHSLLHLVGHDHETCPADARRMTAEQNRIYAAVAEKLA